MYRYHKDFEDESIRSRTCKSRNETLRSFRTETYLITMKLELERTETTGRIWRR